MDTGLDVRAFNASTAAAAVSVAVVAGAVPDSPDWIVEFGAGAVLDGPADPERLGGKGAGLAAMARLGVPVPPGFILTTGAGQRVRDDGHRLPPALEWRIESALAALEARSGARFGGRETPLLLAVRSGAKVSMPGMMDTVLNLGLNNATVEGLAERHGDARFAYDCYRRLIQTYAPVVLGVPAHAFDDLLDEHKRARGLVRDADLTAEDWRILLPRYAQAVEEACGRPFPQDPHEQLREAIGAVFRSWNNPRAVAYRALHGLPDQGGTAVTVQAMAFGNRDERSGSGVLFTRDPSTGAPGLCGEFLANAQGEDVVSGVRDPDPLTDRQSAERARAVGGRSGGSPSGSMESRMPDVFAALLSVAGRLERAFGDMQDIEFTVESGRLFILQTRAGKRSSAASVRIAVDLAEEGIIARDEAVRRVDPRALDELLRPTLAPGAEADALAIGLPASPGAVTGCLAFTGDEAVRLAGGGVPVILCRPETAPDDILGMQAAAGILTARGGFTSHAATVARGLGRPCVAGARTLRIDVERGVLTVGAVTLRGGDLVTIDGSSGAVLAGAAPLTRTEPDGAVARLLEWTKSAV
ncbi:PEP/pyruvate-binding domain-containing protein [Azospirillum doebereinerae]